MAQTYDQLKLENQLCFPLYAAARKITSLYTPYLKKLGITYTQYVTMMVLWEASPIQVKDLCQKLYLDNGTVTPVIRNLIKKGYVKKEHEGSDERAVYISLTKKGEQLKEQAKNIPGCVYSSISGITHEQSAELYRLLYQLLNQK